jgi:hypothetical protein
VAYTTNHNLPYPTYADAPDGPGQVQALAEAVDSSLTEVDTSIRNLEQADRTAYQVDFVGRSLPEESGTAGAWSLIGGTNGYLLFDAAAWADNGGRPVTVLASFTCTLQQTLDASSNTGVRIGISSDGGTTYTYPSNAVTIDCGTDVGIRQGAAVQATWSGVPTGNITIRASINPVHASTLVRGGFLSAHIRY